ncbi:MAG TPA: PQQ-binding-like beta-propeller repeat protein, partial [Candidatus Polarisedimenticolia bacterium]|nr:PQQ-binding-like beta-propeller repeat protein [Candidatus Polarisedimenticolia bacterium]
SLGGEAFSRTLSSVAVRDGLVYAADLRGFINCLDAATGQILWSHDLFAQVWGSPLVADGKVYIGDEDGDATVLRAGRTKELLHEVNMGNAIYTTPAARDGVLYIATRAKLFAIQNK